MVSCCLFDIGYDFITIEINVVRRFFHIKLLFVLSLHWYFWCFDWCKFGDSPVMGFHKLLGSPGWFPFFTLDEILQIFLWALNVVSILGFFSTVPILSLVSFITVDRLSLWTSLCCLICFGFSWTENLLYIVAGISIFEKCRF